MINGESTNSQDARLEELWRKLDAKGKGYLDLESLKLGLRKIDHRMLFGAMNLGGKCVVSLTLALKLSSMPTPYSRTCSKR